MVAKRGGDSTALVIQIVLLRSLRLCEGRIFKTGASRKVAKYAERLDVAKDCYDLPLAPQVSHCRGNDAFADLLRRSARPLIVQRTPPVFLTSCSVSPGQLYGPDCDITILSAAGNAVEPCIDEVALE